MTPFWMIERTSARTSQTIGLMLKVRALQPYQQCAHKQPWPDSSVLRFADIMPRNDGSRVPKQRKTPRTETVATLRVTMQKPQMPAIIMLSANPSTSRPADATVLDAPAPVTLRLSSASKLYGSEDVSSCDAPTPDCQRPTNGVWSCWCCRYGRFSLLRSAVAVNVCHGARSSVRPCSTVG
uniref:Uncharacterized protein n=1 Tax=Anopheles culicifacies TaxID=139723 RepID=A0A182MR73_9DIPT